MYLSLLIGFLKILEIPRGARHIIIREFKGTPHILGRSVSRCLRD